MVQTTGIAEVIEKGINGFLEDLPTIMKALDEVGKVHPFINGAFSGILQLPLRLIPKSILVAVLAFKAVYTLETTRRENDKKLIALYVEMKDMMAVLIQWVSSLSLLEELLSD